MSITRQQRRAMKRKLGGNITNEQADSMILALRESTTANKKAVESEVNRQKREISERCIQRIKHEWELRIKAQTVAETIIMVLAFEHIDRGHTGKYLAKYIHDFNEFGDAVNSNGQGIQPLIDILRDECGLDIEKEFAACEAESNERKRETA